MSKLYVTISLKQNLLPRRHVYIWGGGNCIFFSVLVRKYIDVLRICTMDDGGKSPGDGEQISLQ